MGQTILEMAGIKKSFSGIYALNGIDFTLSLGEVHALLGENGAGKSTLIKVLGGIYQPDAGKIKIDGKEVKITNVSSARNNGIGIIHQEIVLVPYLSVARNLFLGRELTTKFGTVDGAEMNRQASQMLSSLGVKIDANTLIEDLTIAQQQMIEIVKAVSFNGKIIVMDEPTSSLSNEEVEQLFEIIVRLKKKKVSIIYISHRMEELFRISDRVTVIRDGVYVGTRKTEETTANELVSMMVGRTLDNFYARDFANIEKSDVALEVKNLSGSNLFKDVSFSLHKGEILGFSGLVGAGRSEIMETIFGARPIQEGSIYLHGKEVHFKSPMEAIKAGIAMVPEDRKKQGLVLGNSVAFNMVLSSLDFCMNGIAISENKRKKIVDHYTEKLRLKAASPSISAGSLSGGNQQKVVLGKWLSTKPDVLILDEPTRGVDVNAKFEIYSVINEMAKSGIAIIMVSSELPEIINMCDNVCVVRAGRLVKKLSKNQLSQEEIMKYAAGGIGQNESEE
ncbi:MAG: sugar ABC transporter ATP-binding protein [Eubacteriales bacterium]|nr:sugar ABC transporter ATP-binding protein [Eubacteriales bacterium]